MYLHQPESYLHKTEPIVNQITSSIGFMDVILAILSGIGIGVAFIWFISILVDKPVTDLIKDDPEWAAFVILPQVGLSIADLLSRA